MFNTLIGVLILVVVEYDIVADELAERDEKDEERLNPCCSGI